MNELILDPRHGSYRPEDVHFLVKPIQICTEDDVAKKEYLIQSGARHYSEMLSEEKLPSPAYLALYHHAFAHNLPRLAGDCLKLAALIAARKPAPQALVLVSLLRAGTPIGVILKHLLQQRFGRTVTHYSVSIIRDRGLDMVALQQILAAGHAPSSLVFLDGWTGKGGITRQLQQSLRPLERSLQAQGLAGVDDGIYVLSDLAGVAAGAASHDDYLIPSAILNSTVSGLISRTVLNSAIGMQDFHGCRFYPQFAAQDLSRQFVDGVIQASHGLDLPPAQDETQHEQARRRAAAKMHDFLQSCEEDFGISDSGLIKPGIGEATRALLRRAPERLLLRDLEDPAIAHMLALAQEKNIPFEQQSQLPFLAACLIKNAKEV